MDYRPSRHALSRFNTQSIGRCVHRVAYSYTERWASGRQCVVHHGVEPTEGADGCFDRGIDIGAKTEIYQIMRRLAEAGKSILMVSSELPELIGVCDRIAVYRDGGIAAILSRGAATEELIMQMATS